MMRKILFLILLVPISVFSQKIEQSKRELNEGRSERNSSSNSSSSSSSSDDGENPFTEMLIDATLGVLVFVTVGDYGAETHLDNNLTPYPFFDSQSGNFERQDSVFKFSFRLDFEDQLMYSNNDLYGNHMKLKVRPFQYFYLQGDYRAIIENRLDGNRDNLSLFHLNFCYDRLRFEKFNFGWNLGVSYVGNNVRKAGFSYGLSAEYFLGKRLSFSAAAKWSRINTRPVNTYEFQGRLHKNMFYFALGYQHLKIATPTYNFITAGGGFYF